MSFKTLWNILVMMWALVRVEGSKIKEHKEFQLQASLHPKAIEDSDWGVGLK